jgi:hypothetical protein
MPKITAQLLLSKLIRNLGSLGKNSPKFCATFVIKKTANSNSSPIGREFGQSGHPGPHHRFSFVTVSTTDDPDKPVMTALGFLGRLPGGKSTPKPPQQGLNP